MTWAGRGTVHVQAVCPHGRRLREDEVCAGEEFHQQPPLEGFQFLLEGGNEFLIRSKF